MSEQEKFDDLVRSKFSEEGDFPFDEGNWEKAEEMIVATRQKEKRRRWGIIFLSCLLIGMLVMIPLIIIKGKDTQLAVKKDKEQITSNNVPVTPNTNISSENQPIEKSSVAHQNETTYAQNTKHEKEEKTTATAPTIAKEEKTKTTAVSRVVTTPVNTEKEKTAPVVKENTTPVVTPPVKTISEPVTKKGNGGASSPSGASLLTKKNDVSIANTVIAKKQEEPKTTVPVVAKEKKEPVATKEVSETEIKTTDPVSQNSSGKEKIRDNKVADQSKEEKKNEVVPVEANTAVAVNTSANESTTPNAVVITPAKDSVKKEEPVVAKKDSTPPVVTPPAADLAPETHHSWTLSADLGMNGFISGGNGISAIGGINITKVLNEKWEIGTGVYYTYIPTYAGTSTFTTSVDYDFGSTLKLTEIVTNKLHYVNAPLFVKYNFNPKNAVILGANFYYLFNSSNIVTSYELSYTGIKNKSTSKGTGYYNSFSPYDMGLMVGYRRDLVNRLGLGVYLNYGLMNLQKPGAFNEINIHNNMSGQLMLTYKIFK